MFTLKLASVFLIFVLLCLMCAWMIREIILWRAHQKQEDERVREEMIKKMKRDRSRAKRLLKK